LAISSRSEGRTSHFGVGLGRGFRLLSTRGKVIFLLVRPIGALLRECNRLWLFVAHLHAQPARRGRNRQVAVAQPSHQVKGLADGLLLRKLECVVRDVLLDGLSHVWGGSKEPIRRHQASDALVRAAEVVAIDEERHSPRAVGEVGKDRTREELVPQRLPESFYLAHRLRVLRPALDMSDALTTKLLLEVRLATPRGVLPTLVGQYFFGCSILGNGSLESLHHQPRLLMVRQRV
jgi:hypothetical protein